MGELGFLNCDDICMRILNKQLGLFGFIFNSVYVDLKCNEIYLTCITGSRYLCGVCCYVVVFGICEVVLVSYVDSVVQ